MLLLSVGALVLMLGLAYYFAVRSAGGGIPCIIYTLTGIYCPGCGITRMFTSLLSGNFGEAFRYNLLVMLLLPFFAFFGARWAIGYVKEGFGYRGRRSDTVFLVAALILLVLFAILRNTEEFAFLAPV